MIDKIKKIDFEILIFILCIFLQNFSFIKTKDFGISCLCVFLLYTFLRYNFFTKINKKMIIFVLISLLIIFIGFYLNHFFNIFQLGKFILVLFIIFSGYHYIKKLFDMKKCKQLLSYSFIAAFIICIYGIYQFFASKYSLPMFLNIFNNNPSYAVRGIYEVYGGWVGVYRIYTTFFEPSVYAIFLANLFFIFLLFIEEKNKFYYITMVLIILNIIFTFSRSGWIVFACYLCVYFYYKHINKRLKSGALDIVLETIILLLPFFNLILMYYLGLFLFKDNSSLIRTYSSIYYLIHSFDDMKYILFGHGIGSILSITKITLNRVMIEPFAHNGYIELIYLLGWPYFIYIMYTIKRFFVNIKNNKLFSLASISTLCCYGAYYNVESLAIISVLFICYTKFYKDVVK